MGFFLIVVIVGLMCYLVAISLTKSVEKENNRLQTEADMYREYLSEYCVKNGYPKPPYLTAMTNETYVNLIPGYIWDNAKYLMFCPDRLNLGEGPLSYEKVASKVLAIKLDDIEFYTKDGSVSYTNKVINKGQNISITGAVVGGIVAGGAGAVIGAGKDANKLENVTVTHDKVKTYIYYKINDEVKLAKVEGENFYSYILSKVPEKEYSYILKKQIEEQKTIQERNIEDKEKQNEEDVTARFEKLDKLYKAGIITNEEYQLKRKEIIDTI